MSDSVIYSTLRDDDAVGPLLPEFVKSLHAQAAEIETFLKRGDAMGISRVAHRVRGAGMMYGFPAISAQAAVVEDALKQGGLANVASGVQALIQLMRSAAV